MIPFGAAAPARNEPTPSGSRWLSFACSRETATSPPAAAGSPTSIVIFAQPGTGRKNADPAPTRTKAIISSRCAQSRLPPARENPGQRGPAVTLSTATFEASPRRPGRTVSRNEPTELAVYMPRKPIAGERTVDVHASARSGCTAAQIARPASRKRQSGVAAAEITRRPRRRTSSSTAAKEIRPITIAMLRRPTCTFTASAIRRARANPWKGVKVSPKVGLVARMNGVGHTTPHRATVLHGNRPRGKLSVQALKLPFQPGLSGGERVGVARLEDDLDGAPLGAEARVRADADFGVFAARGLEHLDDAALGRPVRPPP